MKESKKVQKAIQTLETMVDYLHFYMGGTNEFNELVHKDITPLLALLKDLSMDQRKQNARLAKKLKAYWESKE
jgi:septal ring factor EnvC (AmiA/AmiB activator)